NVPVTGCVMLYLQLRSSVEFSTHLHTLPPACLHPHAQRLTTRSVNVRPVESPPHANVAASSRGTQCLTKLSNLRIYGCLLRFEGFDGKFDQAVGHRSGPY